VLKSEPKALPCLTPGHAAQKREKMTKARLRISGLVRAQRRAEEAVEQGISSEEIQAFLAWTASIVAQVDDACRQYQLSPQDLPAPSFRAYQFLKSLNTPESRERLVQTVRKKKKAPKAQAAARQAEPQVLRLRNLISIVENLHQMLDSIAQALPVKEADAQLVSKPLLTKIQGHVHKIEMICQEGNSSPQNLPGPSLRAYQWLRFLSDENHLSSHLKALQRTSLQVESLRPKFPARLRSLPVEVRYYNLPGLYRSQVVDGRLLLVVNEAFIEAPPSVMENMIWVVLLPKQRKKAPLAEVRQYADAQTFIELAQKINNRALESGAELSRGRYHDLKASFERVNRRYFQNQMAIPRLVWGQRLSKRKLGHYQPATDTLQVSRTLDNADVPAFVVDFIVYHELLHKQLGARVAAGRHYSHTPEFKQAERRFHRYQQAQDFLNGIGENLEL
jgi:hypothetical protein